MTHRTACMQMMAACVLLLSCGNEAGNKAASPAGLPVAAVPVPANSAAARPEQPSATADSLSNERAFRACLALFKQSVARNDSVKLCSLLYFPLQTMQWSNSDKAGMTGFDPAEGLVCLQEFSKYYTSIFHAEVLRLLPRAGEDQLSVIDQDTPEDYYRRLYALCDKGASLYEVYLQYPEASGSAESYFAFVFGKIKGRYKVLAYYGKWPVKG